jgi:hypothetical protein
MDNIITITTLHRCCRHCIKEIHEVYKFLRKNGIPFYGEILSYKHSNFKKYCELFNIDINNIIKEKECYFIYNNKLYNDPEELVLILQKELNIN